MNTEHPPKQRRKEVVVFGLGEILALLGVIWVFGGLAVPAVNEVYYLGKAIHFWNPHWIVGDAFLQSRDAHWFFYAAYGWISLLLSPTVFAWCGRILAWVFLAWSWARLSHALLGVRFFSVISLSAFLYYLDAFQMSGEWIVGGIEGKCFAYPFLLLALEAIVRNRWKSVWIYLGAASAFHVLVGGWAVVIALVLYFSLFTRQCFLRNGNKNSIANPLRILPFLILGGLLSLPGLVPALMLDYGVAREIVAQAHFIYVFERLPHHLVPGAFPLAFRLRFGILTALFLLLCGSLHLVFTRRGRAFYELPPEHNNPLPMGADRERNSRSSLLVAQESRSRFLRLELFVLGSLGLAVIGFAVDFLFRDDPQTAAHLLRYYWFRMSDFAVPLGFSLVCSRLLLQILDPLKTAFFRELQGNFSAETIVIAVRKWAKTFLVLFFGSFCVFLLVNGFLFDCNHAFWNPPPENAMKFLRERPPEPGISWGLTLLSGIIVLLLGPIFRRKKLNNGLENRVILCGWLLLFGSVLIWNPAVAVISLAKSRTEFSYSQSDPQQSRVAYCWRDVCEWINDPENAIAAEARFLTPQDAVSFKWLTRRPEVAVWKEVPQDAAGIVQWYSVMEEIYLHKDKNGVVHREYPVELLLHRSSPQQFRTRMNFLRDKYRFDYILCGKFRRLNLPLEYENAYFVVYRVPEL